MKLRIHESITPERIEDACERSEMGLENVGICTACGAEEEGCEPDMRNGRCGACGAMAVHGAEELALMAL